MLHKIALFFFVISLWQWGNWLWRIPSPPAPIAPLVISVPAGTVASFVTTGELHNLDVPSQRRDPLVLQQLLADLGAAQHTIRMVTFEYNLPQIADALIAAQQRGVQVGMVLDRETMHHAPMAAWAGRVQAAGITVAWEESSAFMHSKFIVIDRQLIWTGSWNATINDTFRNNNNLIRSTIPALVAAYEEEFARLAAVRSPNQKPPSGPRPTIALADGEGGIESFFAPQELTEAAILARISQAQTSIDFLAFAFTSDTIAAALIERAAAGVVVRGVIERRNANGIGADSASLRAAGIELHNDGNCYTMHHKVIIIDQQIVITGSYNFTRRAEEVNAENTLIIDHHELARAYGDEFLRVYQRALLPNSC